MTSISQYNGVKWEEVINFESLRGKPGQKGDPANPAEMFDIAKTQVDLHVKQHDHSLLHDAARLGSLLVDETDLAEGKIVQVRNNKLVYVPLPAPAQQNPYYQYGGRGFQLPDQEGNSGKFLTTNGSDPSWASVAAERTVVSKSGDYTAQEGEIILVDASGGDVTITLPSPTGITSPIDIKKIDSSTNQVIIDGDGANIDGASTREIDCQYVSISVVTNATNWFIV